MFLELLFLWIQFFFELLLSNFFYLLNIRAAIDQTDIQGIKTPKSGETL